MYFHKLAQVLSNYITVYKNVDQSYRRITRFILLLSFGRDRLKYKEEEKVESCVYVFLRSANSPKQEHVSGSPEGHLRFTMWLSLRVIIECSATLLYSWMAPLLVSCICLLPFHTWTSPISTLVPIEETQLTPRLRCPCLRPPLFSLLVTAVFYFRSRTKAAQLLVEGLLEPLFVHAGIMTPLVNGIVEWLHIRFIKKEKTIDDHGKQCVPYPFPPYVNNVRYLIIS